jgi:hypothetical protein
MNGQFALDAILTKAFHENFVDLAKLPSRGKRAQCGVSTGHIAGYKELRQNHIRRIRMYLGVARVAQDSSETTLCFLTMTMRRLMSFMKTQKKPHREFRSLEEGCF